MNILQWLCQPCQIWPLTPAKSVPFPWVSSCHTGHLERCLLTCCLPSLSHSWFPLIHCCWSVAKSCPNLCDPMDSSTPGFPVLYYLLEFVKTHVRWVGDALQPSNPLLPHLLLPSVFPSISFFSPASVFFPPVGQLFASGGQSIGASASAPDLPMNIQGWLPLGLTGLISLLSKGLSNVFSSTTNLIP